MSKHRNHLLKAPFCVHPKTGRVCVPVDPERIEEFDPERVPTVTQLLHELDSIGSEEDQVGEHHSGKFPTPRHILATKYARTLDWEKTSLKGYVDMLDKHSLRLMEQVRQEKRALGLPSLSFLLPFAHTSWEMHPGDRSNIPCVA